MKIKLFSVYTILLICFTLQIKAQTEKISPENGPPKNTDVKDNTKHQLNFIKVNIMSLLLKNYSLQYERVLNKTISIAVAYRTMPSTGLPFKNQLLKFADNDPDSKDVIDIIENFRMSNMAFTPEVRFYLGKKGYGRGFYIAPFYRYAKFKTDHWILTRNKNTADEKTINLSGDLTSNTGGILFGAQWALGRHFCLDWSILGPHYGSGVGNFTGLSNKPLTQADQDDLRKDLTDLDLPLTNKTVSVNANGASLKLDGPWGGIRSGISLGFKF